MKVAVLFNSFAGGHAEFYRYGAKLARVFQGHTVMTCSAGMGERYLAPVMADLQVAPCNETSFLARMQEAAARMSEARPDLLICVGGDGFIAYVADWMIRRDKRIPLLGLAGGTANVGPLIRFTPDSLDGLTVDRLRYEPVGAVEVSADGHVLGYAFNDLIIGDTFLASIDGRMANVAASDFLRDGSKRIAAPSADIVGDRFQLVKNGQRVGHKLRDIAQIIVSPLHRKSFYRGKAITGALCSAGFSEDGAAVGLCDRILVDSHADAAAERTVLIEHLLFKERDVIEMSGFSDKGCLIIDGNPFPPAAGAVAIRYAADAIASVYST